MQEIAHADELAEIERWFADRRFGLAFVNEDGLYWASLTRLASGEEFFPKYGRGSTVITAARSAKERYEVEE